jgi:Right handed beta helix region
MKKTEMATKNTKNHNNKKNRSSIVDWSSSLTFFVIFCVCCGHSSSAARAGEITTNGTGGGNWNEPATWRGGAVPKPDEEVTIRKGDAVLFDRNDDGKITCAKLFIDPKGALTFKKGAGKVIFVTPGAIESFGVIKLDGTASADDFHELRLTGKTPEDRTVKFDKGGLVLSGKANLPGGKRNVRVAAKAPDPKATDVIARIELKGGMLDVRHAEFQDVKLEGNDIDNTGSKAGERCNIIGNRLLGRSGVSLLSCDTPHILDNLFDYPGGPWQLPPAIALNGCPLAEVKNNTIKGYFYYAFSIYGCTDAVVIGNSTDKCYVGAYCIGTTLFKGNTIQEAGGGFALTSFTGTVEDCTFIKCAYGIHLSTGSLQLTNCVYKDPPKMGHAIDYAIGDITLINCPFGPGDINLPKTLPKTDKPLITSMHFFILKVDGKVPEDSQVDVKTVNPKPPIASGAADLNVRNTPAPLVGNRTPLPQSLSPIFLKGWVIDKDGKTIPAPEYSVRVLAPAEDGKEAKVLKTLTVKPDEKWFRAKPNDPAPTVEVRLK